MALWTCLRQLEAYTWDGSLNLEAIGSYGDSFACPFFEGYRVTFRCETVRDEHRRPIIKNLLLKNVLTE